MFESSLGSASSGRGGSVPGMSTCVDLALKFHQQSMIAAGEIASRSIALL